MSTRSLIIRKNEVGKYESIYCHNDGYPECNGVILYNHYNNPERVKELISLGDMSSLYEFINPDKRLGEHTFDNRQPYTCVFYGRDRGESNVEFKTFDTLREALSQDSWQEYAYVYENDEWRVWECKGDIPNTFEELPKLRDVINDVRYNIRIRQ